MSGTQPKSQLLSIKAWEELSYLLPDESKLSVYYLEALWGDDGFRQGWANLRERFIAEWQERVQELVQRAEKGDKSLLLACIAENRAGVSELAKIYPIPFRIQLLLGFLLFAELLEPLGVPFALQCVGFFGLRHEPKRTKFVRLNTFHALYKRLQLPPPLREYLPAQLGVLLVVWELTSQNVAMLPPLVGLPLPLRSESKEAYLGRVRKLLQADNLPLQEFVDRFSLKGSKFAFRNLRNAKGAVLALAEEYYEQCKVRASNRNEKTLARYVRQVYLRLVKRKTWGEIVNALIDEGWFQFDKNLPAQEQREQWKKWCNDVKKTTRTARKMLGI